MAKIDDSVKKKVPELRFKGFTDEWEERKFKDILKTHSFRSYLAGVSENGEYEVIQQGDKPIVGYSDGEPFTDYKDVTLFGDHTVSLYKPKSPFFVATDGVKILSADNFEGNYLYTTLERYKPEPQGYKRHFTILKNQDVWFTENMEEQQKIGSFFKQLDDTIALHQHKLDLLKEQKKGFLQKMFPKNGAKVPELRFAGFVDDWEERKFESLLDRNEGVRRGPFGSALKKDLFVKESPYVVYEQQNAIYDHYETRYNISKEKFEELHKFELIADDFIMSGAGTIGRISKVPKGIKKGVFNQALIRFRINKELTDSEYFLQFIRADFMQRKLTGANPGSAITNLVPMSDVKKWEIKVPIKEEQQKIGSFFKQLDDTIALHQRKLDLLKEQKKGFLQKMFV